MPARGVFRVHAAFFRANWSLVNWTRLDTTSHPRLTQRTRATPSEMRSIVRVLETNIELSLQRLLR